MKRFKKRLARMEDYKFEFFLRERQNKSIVSITEDGKQIPIDELTDEQLMNIIRISYYDYRKRKSEKDMLDEMNRNICE